MSIRVTCPSCDTTMSVSDEKRGGKVRCKECDESIPVPSSGKKRADDEAIQDSRKVAAKAAPVSKKSRRDEDDDDDRPVGRERKPAKSGGFGVLALVGGGLAALFLVGVLCAGGSVAFLLLGSRPDAPPPDIQANLDKKIDNEIPNPRPDPIPDPRPDPNPGPGPGVKLPPVDPNPGKQLPDAIAPNQVPRVKQATVYLRVTMPSGQVAEGSGFFAVEPSIVITNAHVLGMLQASSKPPRQVEVTLNSGEPNQSKLIGQVLGVDRACDLAIVRVPNPGNLPAPLQLENERKLIETQPVYIFGFPLGAQLGANITVSPSAVSSLRKNQLTGALEQIQVNGGMHPGNSGGPVVNSAGNVVGVAVAGIRGTQINFAVPGEFVKLIMEGRFDDHKMGEAYLAAGQPRLPMKYTCLDPLNRVTGMSVEVWTGMPGPQRPYSLQKPQPMPGDGQRQNHAITYRDGKGELDVPLPLLAPGQVCWLQPVITTAKGTQWGTAVPTSNGLIPLERKAAALMVSLTNAKERTVKINSANTSTTIAGKTRSVFSARVNADMVEFLSPDPLGVVIKTAFANTSVNLDLNGRPLPIDAALGQRLAQVTPTFVMDGTNKLRARSDLPLNPKLAPSIRNQIKMGYWQLCNALESVTLPMPNRTLQPKDTWQTQIPMLLRSAENPKEKPEVVDLEITCTYEGTRTKNQRDEAVISVAGRVRGRDAAINSVDGDVNGKFAFDLPGGFISQAIFKISSEDDVGGGLTFIDSFDINMTRTAGNPLNLKPVEFKKQDPGPQAKAVLKLNAAGNLAETDPMVNHPGLKARMKVHPITMKAGNEYVIALNSNAFDSFLILESPKGQKLAEDDDGGGFPHARIVHRAMQDGVHRIIVTAFDGKTGPYQLTVHEIGNTDVVKKNDPPAKKEDPPKKGIDFATKIFKKPAASPVPTSYLKIVSTPGDFIGQGKSFDFLGPQLTIKKTPRGVHVKAGGWDLDVGAPRNQFLAVGEYLNAKRFPFSGDSPGLEFRGQGRASNKIGGEFVVWELEMNGDQITRLAIDFVQRSEEKGQPLNGKVRFNSTLQ